MLKEIKGLTGGCHYSVEAGDWKVEANLNNINNMLILFTFLLLWQNTKAVYRRKCLFGLMVPECWVCYGRHTAINSKRGSRSRKLRAWSTSWTKSLNLREQTKVVQVFKLSSPSIILPLARPNMLKLPNQYHQLRTKNSNSQNSGRHLSFTSP